MNFKYLVTFLLFSLLIATDMWAQRSKIKIADGTAQLRLEQNMTKEDAYRKVEQLAIIDGISNAFGTYVAQEANLTVESGKSRFNIIGTTKVKGELIETLEKKIKEDSREVNGEYGKQQELWITCTVKIRAKEATPKANIESYSLALPNIAGKSFSFNSGDNLYLYFKSPINGYLSVYLDDNKNIYRILPYNNMETESSVKVIADKEYIFFSKEKTHNYFNNSVDELELFTPLKREINTLHILFSETNYYKPRLTEAKKTENNYLLPKSLSRQQSADWLAETKATIDDFVDFQIQIEILGEK